MSIIEVACMENNLEVLKYLQERILLPNIDEYMEKNIQKLFASVAGRKHSQILAYLSRKYGDHLDHNNVENLRKTPLVSIAQWCQDSQLLNELIGKINFSQIRLEALKVALEFGNLVTSILLLETDNFDIISPDDFHIFHYAAKGPPYDCATSREVREILEQRCPRTLATKILLPLDEYEKRRDVAS